MKPNLKLVQKGEQKQQRWSKRQNLNKILLVLGAAILVQMALGWAWNRYSYSVIETTRAEIGFMENQLEIYGLVMLNEEVFVLPRSGYAKPLVEEGMRVPVGKELAVISSAPLEGPQKEEEKGFWESLPVIGGYLEFKQHEKEVDNRLITSFEEKMLASQAGIVSFQIDGFEKYGPDNVLYLTQEEIKKDLQEFEAEKSPDFESRLTRGVPFLKIIDNFKWFYAAVLQEVKGSELAELSQVGIYFDFAPEKRVTGRLVEEYKDGSYHYFTWEITRELPQFYLHRVAKANLTFDRQEGIILPLEAIVEINEEEGVYLLEGGVVRFQKILVKQAEEEQVLVEGITPNSQVITNPKAVKEGMLER